MQGEKFATGSSIKHFGPVHLKQMTIQIPPLSEQKLIVEQINFEKQIINANKELIRLFEQKIEDELNKLWDK